MKVLAIIEVAPGASVESIRSQLVDELLASWALFLSGVLREAYATDKPTRLIFIFEADDVHQANAHVRTLPLVAQGLFRVELIELRPFANWAKLFAS
jgi:hypothetical protein